MSLKLCPVCVQVNPEGANYCHACGMVLLAHADAGDTLPDSAEGQTTVRNDLPATVRGGLPWNVAGELATTVRADLPASAREDEGLKITLRQLEAMPEPVTPPRAAGAARSLGAAAPTRPTGGRAGVGRAGPGRAGPGSATPWSRTPAAALRRPVEPVLPALIESDPVAPAPLKPETARGEAKAAKRARVRSALRAASGPRMAARAGLTDVLVMDADEVDRRQLCSLLETFGFEVHATQHVAQALALLEVHGFAAVFAAIALNGSPTGAAARLCERVTQGPSLVANKPAPALVIVGERSRTVDRVRAALVGAAAFLLKPLGRGDVVRTLEDCGVTLPMDARRG